MSNILGDTINRKNAILHIDVTCWKCKKLWARSYCSEGGDGRYYCQKCTPSLGKAIEAIKLIRTNAARN
jgi:hypothetical protein